jgi:nitrite reductase (NADH) small subunit/3-phenylpropionate/trans-cinnamate dioxygenase ferredoxin subunit
VSVEFIPVAKVADVAPGSATTVVVDGREIAVFHIGEVFYALDNTCPHQGGPLADGWIEGATVTCPWHAWCFRLEDGKMALGDFASVDAFAVRVDGDTISVARSPKADAPRAPGSS